MAYTGMWRRTGYGFWPLCPKQGYKILRESVLNIVYDFVRVSPKYKQEEICLYPKCTKAITITWI